MYYVIKQFEIAGAHQLRLGYTSKCNNIHGHNWKITVKCRTRYLNDVGMVVDFTQIKKTVEEKLDHQFLNEVLSFNPTAENIAEWICDQIPNCIMVQVEESEGNIAIYEKDL